MVYLLQNIHHYPDSFYQTNYQLLNVYQKAKINKIKSLNNQKLSLLALALVAEKLNVPIKDIHYQNHRPYVKGDSYFSITHKYPYVGIAISNQPIGIDLEILKELPKPTLTYLASSNSLEALIKWTKKESLIKCLNKTNPTYQTIIIDHQLILTICQ